MITLYAWTLIESNVALNNTSLWDTSSRATYHDRKSGSMRHAGFDGLAKVSRKWHTNLLLKNKRNVDMP